MTNINTKFNLQFENSKRMRIPKVIRSYTIQKLIIETAKSVVVASNHPDTNDKVAIKCIPIDTFRLSPNEDVIMRQLDHPQIVKYYESFPYPDQNPRFFVIVMRRGVYDLLDYIERNKTAAEPIVCKIMKDSLTALHYLHSLNICHRDIKLDNILVMDETRSGLTVNLTDFGLSVKDDTGILQLPGTGTFEYSAPELLQVKNGRLSYKSNAQYGFNVDVWSMGIVMFALLAGYLPFDIGFQNDVERLFKGEVSFDPIQFRSSDGSVSIRDSFRSVSQEAQMLISQMLNPDPDQRLSVEDVLNDPWFQIYQDGDLFNQEDNNEIFDAFNSEVEG